MGGFDGNVHGGRKFLLINMGSKWFLRMEIRKIIHERGHGRRKGFIAAEAGRGWIIWVLQKSLIQNAMARELNIQVVINFSTALVQLAVVVKK